jgi:hypothetical protein
MPQVFTALGVEDSDLFPFRTGVAVELLDQPGGHQGALPGLRM